MLEQVAVAVVLGPDEGNLIGKALQEGDNLALLHLIGPGNLAVQVVETHIGTGQLDVGLFQLLPGAGQLAGTGYQETGEDGHGDGQNSHDAQCYIGEPAVFRLPLRIGVLHRNQEAGDLPGTQLGIVEQGVFLGDPQIMERAVYIDRKNILRHHGQGGIVLHRAQDVALGTFHQPLQAVCRTSA